MLPLKVPYCLRKAIEAKKIPAYFKFSLFISGSAKNEGLCKISIPYRKEFNLDKAADILHNYLRKVLPEFKDAYVYLVSAELLERDGLTLGGDYTLTEQDVLRGKIFPDAVARGNRCRRKTHAQCN